MQTFRRHQRWIDCLLRIAILALAAARFLGTSSSRCTAADWLLLPIEHGATAVFRGAAAFFGDEGVKAWTASEAFEGAGLFV